MGLTYHPKPGTMVMCDFSTGFSQPEMVKRRPVLIISPKMKRGSDLCTVVAISSAAPDPVEKWHYALPTQSMPQSRSFQRQTSWVKGDMIYRVSFDRLNRIQLARKKGQNKRRYFNQRLGREQMADVYGCVLHALNLSHLSDEV